MIAFTADNHVGITSQWSLKERSIDFMNSFHNVIESIICRGEKNSTLIIGGDLFDTPYPPSFAVEFVQKEISRLKNAINCSVVGIDGNHDIADGKWLRVCGIEPLTTSPFTVTDDTGVRICGIHYTRASTIISELENMANTGVKCDILVLHLALGELNRMGATSDIAASEMMHLLKEIGIKIVLIGHIHIRQSVVVDGITFAYCGSTEICSMNEPKDKSFDEIIVKTWSLEKISIATRKVNHTVISTEDEFAKYESSIVKGSDILQSVFVTPNVTDGVKRLRALAKSNNIMMRVQIMRPSVDSDVKGCTIDRSSGVTSLEQAISLSFKPESCESDLIKAILRAPDTTEVIINNFMNGSVSTDNGGLK